MDFHLFAFVSIQVFVPLREGGCRHRRQGEVHALARNFPAFAPTMRKPGKAVKTQKTPPGRNQTREIRDPLFRFFLINRAGCRAGKRGTDLVCLETAFHTMETCFKRPPKPFSIVWKRVLSERGGGRRQICQQQIAWPLCYRNCVIPPAPRLLQRLDRVGVGG